MTALITYAWRSVIRQPARSLTYLVGLMLAVGLFADTLFFVDLSKRDMTANALAPIQVDMIARATDPALSGVALESTLKGQPLVKDAVGVASSDFATLSKVGGSTATPAGKVFALPERYYSAFGFLPIVSGKFDPGAALVGDATATQMGLKVGDSLELRFAAGLAQPYRVRISGIVAMGSSEPLFYNPSSTEGFGVVSDVVFIPPALFERDLAPALSKLPVTTTSVGQTGSNIVLLPVERQVHLKIDRNALNPDPAKASKELDALRRSLERPFPGQVRVQDNLSQKLFNAKKDILAAKMLFIFLTLPGILLAAYLSKYATELAAEERRREFGLLRVRGAGAREVLLITAFTAVSIALAGSLLGLLFGGVVLGLAMGPGIFSNLSLMLPSALWAMLGGLALTVLAFFLPAWSGLRQEILGQRRSVSRAGAVPLWRRMNLDFLALIAATIVLYVTNANGGFKPVGTEGTAVTLSFYLFLAPFLYWVGSTLLLARLFDLLLTRGGSFLGRTLGITFGPLGQIAAKGMSRRSGAVGAAVTLTALALSFGIGLALFLGTYNLQKQGDIRYVVGSDVRVTPPASAGLTPAFADKLAALPAVQAATSIARDGVALIGSEKKSVYGIDVPSFQRAAYLPDAMFENGSAQATLQALASTPNGVLVARDQADKYGINLGDPVLMRLYNPKSGQYTQLQAKCVGIYTYLSTSAYDSDFVLNRAFMTQQAGTAGADLFLLKSADPAAVTQAIQTQFGQDTTFKLENVLTATKLDQSSLTGLNLAGLGGLERLYTALIVAASLGIFLVSMVQSRRKEFGTMRALGADETQLRALLSAETLSISSIALLSGLAVGTVIASLFVLLLRVIFLIPPAGLAWPLTELGTLLGLVLLGIALGSALANHRLSTLRVSEVLREA